MARPACSALSTAARSWTASAKLYFDGTLYTQDALELLIKVVGPDRVLFGTETPGRGTFEWEGRMLDDLRPAVEQIEWLSPAEKQQIFEDNAKKVFNL